MAEATGATAAGSRRACSRSASLRSCCCRSGHWARSSVSGASGSVFSCFWRRNPGRDRSGRGIVGLILAVKRERPADRQPVMLGLFGSLLVLVVMGLQFATAVSVPPIHNISTDTFDPPQFVDVDRGENSNPIEYTRDRGAATRGLSRPIDPSHRSGRRHELRSGRSVAEDLGWEVFAEARGDYRIEATATTFWFGFKDDIVIRIRRSGTGAIVDLRSVSRVGQSDLGANARRIGAFIERFEAVSL